MGQESTNSHRIANPLDAADLLDVVAEAIRETGVIPESVQFSHHGHVEVSLHGDADTSRAQALASMLAAGELVHVYDAERPLDGTPYSLYRAGDASGRTGFVVVAYLAGLYHPDAES